MLCFIVLTRPAYTRLKPTMEAQEESVKSVQS